jgi:hypothetical protein
MGARGESADAASSSRSSLLGTIDGILTSMLVLLVGLAFIVSGNLSGRIVGLVILSPWIYCGTRQWVRQRSRRAEVRSSGVR